MIWHIFGWTTVVAQGIGGVAVLRWLSVASRDSRSWRRPLGLPKPVKSHITMSSGSDYVGAV